MITVAQPTRIPFSPPPRLGDEEMAEEITRHASDALAHGDRPNAEWYFCAVNDPNSAPESLEAIMAVGIRSLRTDGTSVDESASLLESRYPEFKSAIRSAAAIEKLLVSSRQHDRESVTAVLPPDECGPSLPRSRALRYRVIERIGAGSFGVVYRAEDRLFAGSEDSPEVAIKFVPSDGVPSQQCLAEAIRARRVDHPAVVRVFDAGHDEVTGLDFVVYELVKGGSMQETGGALRLRTLGQRVDLVRKIALGVQAVHRAGLIHRDIKPANVLLTEDWTPKVTDLGLACFRVSPDDVGDLKEAGGAMAFLAPELIGHESSATTSSDVYSLGALASFILTGQLVSGSTVGATVSFHESGGIIQNEGALREVPEPLRKVLARAMDPDPVRRHPSAAAFGEDLQCWSQRRAIEWQRPSALRRISLLARRRPMSSIAAMLIALLSVIGLAQWQRITIQRDFADRWEQRRAAAMSEIQDTFVNMRAGDVPADRRLTLLWALQVGSDHEILTPSLRNEVALPSLVEIAMDERLRAPERSIDRALWSALSGLWMVNWDEPTEQAESLLLEAGEEFARMGGANEPWAYRCQILKVCAVVKRRWMESPSMPEHLPTDANELTETAHQLEQFLEGNGPAVASGALREAALRALQHLYGRRLLRDRTEFDRIHALRSPPGA